MSESRNCYSCGTTFWSNSWTNKCSSCQQTEKLAEQAELDRRQNYELQQAQLESSRLIAAMNATIAEQTATAIERQTQAIFETSITQQDAFNRGLNYIDVEFDSDNPANVSVEMFQNGEFSAKWNHVYVTPILREKFKEGLSQKVNSFPRVDWDHLDSQAKAAGRQHAEGTLDPYFSLYTGVMLRGVTVYSEAFTSDFAKTLDESTGEYKMNWSEPFLYPRLNEKYSEGVNEVWAEVNTDELKNLRLIVDIPNIQRKRKDEQDRKDLIEQRLSSYNDTKAWFSILCWVLPVIGWITVWNVTEGWTTFWGVVGLVPALTFVLVIFYETWAKDAYDEIHK